MDDRDSQTAGLVQGRDVALRLWLRTGPADSRPSSGAAGASDSALPLGGIAHTPAEQLKLVSKALLGKGSS
jgi:hypothetical protein